MDGVPQAIVKRRGPAVRARMGRGFSRGELREVGLSVAEARRLGLMVDERRRSTHKENVARLLEWLQARKRSGA